VQSDGSLVLSNIQTLIDNAKAAGTSIYGHTLCWHSNQNATYLNKLLAPTIIPGDGGAGGYSYKFTNTTAGNFWVSQLAYGLSPKLDNNTEYVLTFFVKGTASGNIRPELQSSADYSSNGFGVVPVTTTWTKFELKTTTTKDTRDRFIISFGDYVGSVYIDNVTLCKSGSTTSIITGGDFENGVGTWGGWGSTSSRGLSALGEGYRLGDLIVEKTAEQKRVLVDGALEKWISGMLSATKDYVKVWDVVNEPMSDYPDPSQLKTGAGKTLAADEFYWQDYLGKDYAVRAIQLARKYGNADDKLFINDYGLEAADQKKCKGLIDYISYVESKGVKVDGIGTQMHVTCGQTTLDGVKAMLTNLAATGKLIKISELDMGYRAAGATANMLTDSVKFAQAQEMPVFKSLPPSGKGRVALTMAIPIGANLGGMGTPIGTPPNAFAFKVLNDPAGLNLGLSFGDWMLIMAPMVLIMLLMAWVIIRKMFPFSAKTIELNIEGNMQHNWRTTVVAVTFLATIVLWVFGKQLGINANTVAMLPIAIFALTGVVTAKDLKEIDWAVIWMVAGGFALGLAMNGTGLAEAAVKSIPFAEFNPLVIMIVSGLVCFILSNFISNTATAALLIPILTVVCAGMGDKLNTIGGTSTILIGVAVSASCAMSLPISTPPNAIAYSTGLIQQTDMVKAGITVGILSMIVGYAVLITFCKMGVL
jgi:anion transporter